LDSAASAESVCAKAIRDGVIDAVIDHDHHCLVSKERTNASVEIQSHSAYPPFPRPTTLDRFFYFPASLGGFSEFHAFNFV
jgi:hypothetical protein